MFPSSEAKTVPHVSAWCVGTHRVLPPQQTWQRLQPFLSDAGITRVADITRLDDIGIPVWQAIRPNSKNLTVSQGKGISHQLARVSAAMESFELFCAEQPPLETRSATVADMAGRLTYAWPDLLVLQQSVLGPDTRLGWARLEDLRLGLDTWAPVESIVVDLRMRARWAPPTVHTCSNGLASGNTLTEATVHALLELMERHALSIAHRQGAIWRSAVQAAPGRYGAAAEVLKRCEKAGVVVQVDDVTCDLGVPTFAARIWSSSVPWWFSGSGAHLDADVALSRAITEAVQSRLTLIAGAHDDLPAIRFQAPDPRTPEGCGKDSLSVRTSDELLAVHGGAPGPHPSPRDLDKDAEYLLQVADRHGVTILRADLTAPSFGIPVVRVIAPGLEFNTKAWA
ncbi:YcaO-like family protein (plasmid) [Streptomyces sp. CA-142005]|uniref:YcaO-like family protein n=1 Tax=Streptomyces sp. CA-142005 TaxID=3240052 RepID=UPI003D8E4A43